MPLQGGPPQVTAAELAVLLREEPGLVLVGFWSPRCEPCRELLPELGRLAVECGEVCRVVALDADREPEAAVEHAVRGLPTLVFFRRGREVHRLRAGALPASMRRWLRSAGS